ncbi:MAG: hypothetical protein IIW44_08695 [Alistipes sp.]|jgi:hypothetical protein|nr:hypothetical protein [Alistipes sp.]MBR0333230.1 hypothetical protein [Alistipes sp.]
MWGWFRSAVSTAFVILFCASFILWYILKLQYTYTTDYSVLVNIEGEQLRVPCVIEGKGTNLLGYRVNKHKEIRIPLSDLKYTFTSDPEESGDGALTNMYIIDPQSMQSAISVRFSDIKVISVGDVPPLRLHGEEEK